MTNRLLRFCIGMTVLTVLFSLASCKNETTSPATVIVGTWAGTQAISVESNTCSYAFDTDKHFAYTTNAGVSENGSYTTDGSAVTMIHALSLLHISASVSGETGDTLTVTIGSESGTFARQSGSASLVGTWKKTISTGSLYLNFKDDGTVVYENDLSGDGQKVVIDFFGGYTLSGTTLDMTFSSRSTSSTYSINGNTMKMGYVAKYFEDSPVKTATLTKQ